MEDGPPPERVVKETPKQRQERVKKRKLEAYKETLEENIASWDVHNNPKATSDAYKTLFVGRLSYDVTDKKLRREFERYGPLKDVFLCSCVSLFVAHASLR